jgi:hypothetical protein
LSEHDILIWYHYCSESDNDDKNTNRSTSSNKEQQKSTVKIEDKEKTLKKVPEVSSVIFSNNMWRTTLDDIDQKRSADVAYMSWYSSVLHLIWTNILFWIFSLYLCEYFSKVTKQILLIFLNYYSLQSLSLSFSFSCWLTFSYCRDSELHRLLNELFEGLSNRFRSIISTCYKINR